MAVDESGYVDDVWYLEKPFLVFPAHPVDLYASQSQTPPDAD